MQPPLQLVSLTKNYGSQPGIKSVSLALQPGEIFGFLGPNGAGKSTTIRSILNFIKPTAGHISVFGLDSVKDSVAVKRHIGYLAGTLALYEKMTGQELLRYLAGLGRQADWRYTRELVRRFDANLRQPIEDLSKGNKQKLGLIQAIMHKPDLLILDEPTTGLDPLVKQTFYDVISEFQQAGKTVFLSSHDLAEVQKICDRAAFIRSGKVVGIETINTFQNLNLRRYIITFPSPPQIHVLKHIANVRDVKIDNNRATVTVVGNVTPLVQALSALHPLDLAEQETNLEELFMHYYQGTPHA